MTVLPRRRRPAARAAMGPLPVLLLAALALLDLPWSGAAATAAPPAPTVRSLVPTAPRLPFYRPQGAAGLVLSVRGGEVESDDDEDSDESDDSDEEEEEVESQKAAAKEESESDSEDEEEDEKEEAKKPVENNETKATPKPNPRQKAALDAKLAASTLKKEATSKVKASKVAVNAKLEASKPKKKAQQRARLRLPYILRACLNPVTVFKMTVAYWQSLFQLDYGKSEPSQELRSALQAKARTQGGGGGGAKRRPPGRGRPVTINDLPPLNT